MSDEEIKNSFKKVKEDIYFLEGELNSLKLDLTDIKTSLRFLVDSLDRLSLAQIALSHQQTNQQTDKPTLPLPLVSQISTPTDTPTHPYLVQTIQHIIPTANPTPTDKLALEASKPLFSDVSTGNEGVPTDRQTNQQTNQHITNPNYEALSKSPELSQNSPIPIAPTPTPPTLPSTNKLSNAAELLKNLDDLKKELRLKFKRLTPQEMAIFALIYNLEEQGEIIDYPFLATKTNLSESSIRDYTHKISLKGIPLIKEKINNKRIVLHVSPDLKKLASLDTILKLREI